ncbi:hypothetical protein [Rhodococcus sp. AW25M09]|uniref:hypothetical protein n=1 Tax=Rhodococcus sp. AW25M09 TaxID=1268303 RepID=UPI0012F73E16|nr:hypothetical protein [Rhodococcus sp. AW25M09]
MTVFAPLRLAHQEKISPAQLGRTLCTEVAEQVPYWVAVLTPAERPLLAERSARLEQTSVTLAVPESPYPPRVLLLAALGSAVCTWQKNNRRGSSAGVLVDLDLDDTGAAHPIRLPAVDTDALTVPSLSSRLVDDVARRLGSVPNAGRDYALARNYPALSSRAGAQILVHDDATAERSSVQRRPRGDYAIDIAMTVTDSGTARARVTVAASLPGVDDLVRLWSAAAVELTAASVASIDSVKATDSSAA